MQHLVSAQEVAMAEETQVLITAGYFGLYTEAGCVGKERRTDNDVTSDYILRMYLLTYFSVLCVLSVMYVCLYFVLLL